MYEKISQKIKSYVKAFTIITMALVMVGSIVAAVLLIRTGGNLSILFGLGAIVLAAIVDLVLYFLSCFAYGFGEMLEQQALQVSLDRQILNALRDQNATPEKKPAPPAPVPQPQPMPVSATATYPPYTPYHNPQPQKPAYPPYPPRPAQPAEPYAAPKAPYGLYGAPQPQNYRTQTPYGTATGFNEDFHYEPKR